VTLRVVLAEDEPLARAALKSFVQELAAETGAFALVGEAADGREALAVIDRTRPDLVLLDIRMPGLDGLSVLRALSCRPEVIFTTAFDRFAVAAFELGAIDYLVKPFGRARFRAAMDRARRRLHADLPPAAERVAAPLEPGKWLDRLYPRRGEKVVPVAAAQVIRLEARGDYVAVRSADGEGLLHVTLAELEQRLDPARFARVHRSHVVNLDHVATMHTCDDRRLLVRMRDGSELIASRAGSTRLRSRAK
jgi:two-component system LytT family response regulator